MTAIVCIADLHEHLVAVPTCDLLVIARDVSFAAKGDLRAKHAFLTGPFNDWLDHAPAEEIVLVAGNHDQSIEAWGMPNGLRCHYLQDDGIELFGLRLWARRGSRGFSTGPSTLRGVMARSFLPRSSTSSPRTPTSWSVTALRAGTVTQRSVPAGTNMSARSL
jgi:hypothetical protein